MRSRATYSAGQLVVELGDRRTSVAGTDIQRAVSLTRSFNSHEPLPVETPGGSKSSKGREFFYRHAIGCEVVDRVSQIGIAQGHPAIDDEVWWQAQMR